MPTRHFADDRATNECFFDETRLRFRAPPTPPLNPKNFALHHPDLKARLKVSPFGKDTVAARRFTPQGYEEGADMSISAEI